MQRPLLEDPSRKRVRHHEKVSAFDRLTGEQRAKAGLLWNLFRTLLQHTSPSLPPDEDKEGIRHQLHALSSKSDNIQYEECQQSSAASAASANESLYNSASPDAKKAVNNRMAKEIIKIVDGLEASTKQVKEAIDDVHEGNPQWTDDVIEPVHEISLALSNEDIELPLSTAASTEVLESPTEVLGPASSSSAMTPEQQTSLEGARKRHERPVEGLRQEGAPEKKHRAFGESLADAQHEADAALRETSRILRQVDEIEKRIRANVRAREASLVAGEAEESRLRHADELRKANMVMRKYATALRQAQPRIDAAMDKARREQDAMMRATEEHTIDEQETVAGAAI